jgi:hypothetical protein
MKQSADHYTSTVKPFTALYKIILFRMSGKLSRRSSNVQFVKFTMEGLTMALVTMQIREIFVLLSLLQTIYHWVTG